MTDDVVEAMARAAHKESGSPWSWDDLSEIGRENWRQIIRAAIRALHERGALVVARMPENIWTFDTDAIAYNAALAAVRANAVEVEG